MVPVQTLDLTGKVALVSGAGVGIGRAVALALGQAGAFVYITIPVGKVLNSFMMNYLLRALNRCCCRLT